MKFENGKEITRICENGKEIVARYCEGHLIWSSGIKLKVVNNIIKGTKYGFVDLGELTWYKYTSGSNWLFYANVPNGKTYGGYQQLVANYWFGKEDYTIKQLTNGGGNTTSGSDKTTYWDASNSQLLIKDLSFNDTTTFKNSLKGKYLIYELSQPDGNTLDTFTAEQIYNLLTLNGTDFTNLELLSAGYEIKLTKVDGNYTPIGRKFECADNIILGTKYGIRDFNLNDGWSYYAGYDGANCLTIQGLKLMGSNVLSNAYLDGFTQITDWRFNENRQEDDYVFAINIYGNAKVRIRGLTTSQQYNNFLKGKYLIYELATPNGTDYNDLSAKEMYDVLCDNQIDILANGKTLNGVRSIVGKQNNFSIIGNTGDNNVYYICNNVGGSSYDTQKYFNSNIIQGHKYYICLVWKKVNKERETKSNQIDIRKTGHSVISITNRSAIYYSDNTYNETLVANETTQLAYISTYSASVYNGLPYNIDTDEIDKAIIIDLTENNLSNLTAQEAYNYFKENNLFKLLTTGVINIGGLKK